MAPYVGVLAVDNDWAHVYVRKGEGFLEGYLANNILTLSALSTGEPIPHACADDVHPHAAGRPAGILTFRLARQNLTPPPLRRRDTAPAEDTAPATDAPQDAKSAGHGWPIFLRQRLC